MFETDDIWASFDNTLDEIFGRNHSDKEPQFNGSTKFTPHYDVIKVNDKEVTLVILAAGWYKSELSIQVNTTGDGSIMVKGVTNCKSNIGPYRLESFAMAFSMKGFNKKMLTASLANGVLSIFLTRVPVPSAEEIIDIPIE